MRLRGIIRSMAVKETKDGPIVVTQVESKKNNTAVDELAGFMGQEADFDIRSPQLRMFGSRVDPETGEIQG